MLANLVTIPAAGFGFHRAQSVTGPGGRTKAKEVSRFPAALSHASDQPTIAAARAKMARAIGICRTSKLCQLTAVGLSVSKGDI